MFSFSIALEVILYLSDRYKPLISDLVCIFNKHFITAIENIRFKKIFVLFEFKHTEFFTSHGDYLLNTTL